MNNHSVTENQPVAATPTVNYATPQVHLIETPEQFLLEAEMPGVTREGLEITVEDGELTLTGHRTVTNPEGRALYRESRDRDFRRVFALDPGVDTSKITARMEQGVVTLVLPKAESQKPRKIEVAG